MDITVDPQAVVAFDLDDTLYFELDYLKSAYWEIALELQPKDFEVLFARMFSLYRGGEDVFAILEADFGIPKRILIEKYRSHYPNIRPREGASDLISEIRKAGAKTVVITDGRSMTQRNKISALGLENLFDAMYVSEELGTEKPNPENFRAVMRQFPKGNYTYLADNPKKDFISPNSLGWQTIGILDNGMHIHKESHKYLSPGYLPGTFIRSLSEINILSGK